MPIHEYKVTLFLEIESDDEKAPDALLVEEAVTSLFEREINTTNVCRGLAFGLHDIDEVNVKKS